MIYRAIGIMSGSSINGVDIAFVEFVEAAGKWTYEVINADIVPYSAEWQEQLKTASTLNALEFSKLHTSYGRYLAQEVNQFIDKNNLHHRVQFIASHGHTVFHEPHNHTTVQIGCGASIAALTGINVISDLRSIDIALGGQGAPIVPMAEKLLWPQHNMFLNLGGIANISAITGDNNYVAFDVCPANGVLNRLANQADLEYDNNGDIARKGFVRDEVLFKLNQEPYYMVKFPKSLNNQFGLETLLPKFKQANLSTQDSLRTMVEHICIQITRSVGRLLPKMAIDTNKTLFITGGGAYNSFLIERLTASLKVMGVDVLVADKETVEYKEAIAIALLGALRWREANTTLASVTGANRSSIGGAMWIGQDA